MHFWALNTQKLTLQKGVDLCKTRSNDLLPLLPSLDIKVERQEVGNSCVYHSGLAIDNHTELSTTAVKVYKEEVSPKGTVWGRAKLKFIEGILEQTLFAFCTSTDKGAAA